MKKLEKKLLGKVKRDQNYKIRLENIIGRKDIGMKRFQANISSHQFRYVTVSSINTVNSIDETIRGDSHSNRGQHAVFSFFRSRSIETRYIEGSRRRIFEGRARAILTFPAVFFYQLFSYRLLFANVTRNTQIGNCSPRD